MTRYIITFDHPTDPLVFRLEIDPPETSISRLLYAVRILERETLIQALSHGLVQGRQQMAGKLMAISEDYRVKGDLEIADAYTTIAAMLEGEE